MQFIKYFIALVLLLLTSALVLILLQQSKFESKHKFIITHPITNVENVMNSVEFSNYITEKWLALQPDVDQFEIKFTPTEIDHQINAIISINGVENKSTWNIQPHKIGTQLIWNSKTSLGFGDKWKKLINNNPLDKHKEFQQQFPKLLEEIINYQSQNFEISIQNIEKSRVATTIQYDVVWDYNRLNQQLITASISFEKYLQENAKIKDKEQWVALKFQSNNVAITWHSLTSDTIISTVLNNEFKLGKIEIPTELKIHYKGTISSLQKINDTINLWAKSNQYEIKKDAPWRLKFSKNKNQNNHHLQTEIDVFVPVYSTIVDTTEHPILLDR